MFNESKMGLEKELRWGANVQIDLKFIRHGERDKDSKLTDYGRLVTKERANESGISAKDYDAIKALGSNAGPKNEDGMGRSFETAHIYAKQIANEKAYNSRKSTDLSFENYISDLPYNHVEIYNSFLPENFSELSDVEKSRAAKIAQTQVVNHLMSLEGPEAENYKNEVAGAYATVVLHHMGMAKKLNSGSKVLRPAGVHGGHMELLLQQALICEDEHGNKIQRSNNLNEIGGDYDPSEAYTVHIETDEKGAFENLEVHFDNPDRPHAAKMYLDMEKLKELAEFYAELHKKKLEMN